MNTYPAGATLTSLVQLSAAPTGRTFRVYRNGAPYSLSTPTFNGTASETGWYLMTFKPELPGVYMVFMDVPSDVIGPFQVTVNASGSVLAYKGGAFSTTVTSYYNLANDTNSGLSLYKNGAFTAISGLLTFTQTAVPYVWTVSGALPSDSSDVYQVYSYDKLLLTVAVNLDLSLALAGVQRLVSEAEGGWTWDKVHSTLVVTDPNGSTLSSFNLTDTATSSTRSPAN